MKPSAPDNTPRTGTAQTDVAQTDVARTGIALTPPDLPLLPDADDPRLSAAETGLDQNGETVETRVTVERALTLFLNGQEIVTMMTIGDYPDCLAVGYLANQNMLTADDTISAIELDQDRGHIHVRTARRTDYEWKLKKRTLTSGCAQGTAFGDVMERFDSVRLDPDARYRTRWIYSLSRAINAVPSLYLTAGAIHGCVLAEQDRPLLYMEDVGRHNAVDKIAGFMRLHGLSPAGKVFYTTGRLTSEMVIKTVQMEIPVLISRSGFTASGVDLARRAGLTLVGRAKGKRFLCLSGASRLVYDHDDRDGADEAPRHSRKGARDD